MRSILLAGMLAAFTCSGQNMQSRFPTMHKALEMGNLISGASRETIANMMCEHSEFARGINILIYMERDTGVCSAMTIFTFLNNKCSRLEVTISYQNDERLMQDADEMVQWFNSEYNEYNDINLVVANYRSNHNASSKCLLWKKASDFVQLSLVEEDRKRSIQLLVLYK